jgi:hypothetical protein
MVRRAAERSEARLPARGRVRSTRINKRIKINNYSLKFQIIKSFFESEINKQ